MRIYHIATLADWKQAQETGSYTTSTYGRTLEQEGFIHAARHDQVPVVRDRFYADVEEPLVVLEIETDLLEVPVHDDQVGDEVYPHVYGPIATSAVVAWRPARFPPIELGDHITSPPPPPTVEAFHGLTVVLASSALTAFFAAAVAQGATDSHRLPLGVSFLLWSLSAVLAVPAVVAFGYAALLLRREESQGR